MKDALERRALLLHLGRVLQLTTRICESRPATATVGELIAQNPMLEDEPLLEYVLPGLLVKDFTMHALRAFCLWPQYLLEDPLDRDALAASVRDHLFRDNPRGWHAYVAQLRTEVKWFGMAKVRRRLARDRSTATSIPAVAGDAMELESSAAGSSAADVERDAGAGDRPAESLEGLTPPRSTGGANEQCPASANDYG